VLDGLRDVPSIEVVVFATNSYVGPVRSPAGRPALQVVYHAARASHSGRSRIAALPSLALWVGDQIATDGLLARASDTLSALPAQLARMPRGPRAMKMLWSTATANPVRARSHVGPLAGHYP